MNLGETMKSKCYMLVSTLFLFACAPQQFDQFISTSTINKEEIAWSRGEGKTRIQGNSFIVDRLGLNGTTHTCVGYEASLIPKSNLVEEYLNYLFPNLEESFWNLKGSIPFKKMDENIDAGARRSKCDINGNFEFTNIPNGTYYLLTTIYYIGGPLRTIPPDYKGGILLKKVIVNNQVEMRVVVSK